LSLLPLFCPDHSLSASHVGRTTKGIENQPLGLYNPRLTMCHELLPICKVTEKCRHENVITNDSATNIDSTLFKV
jgi:hypothetical protein